MAKKTEEDDTSKVENINFQQAINIFSLLNDDMRLRILMTLEKGEINVTDLCGVIGSSQPALSHHLALMRVSRIVESRRDGKCNFYSLSPDGVTALEWARIASGMGQ